MDGKRQINRGLIYFAALLLLTWTLPPRSEGQTPSQPTATSLPSVEEAQQALVRINEQVDLPAEIKPLLIEGQTKLLDSVKQLAEVIARRNKLDEQIAAVPQDLKTVKKDLEFALPPLPQVASSTPLDRVRTIKSEKDAELAAAKAKHAELLARIENRKTRRAQATELVASLRTELQKVEAEVPPSDAEGKTDPKILLLQKQEREARLELLRQRLALQQLELRAFEAEEELLPLQLQLATRHLERLEKELTLLTQAISSRREIKVEDALKSHRDALQAANVNPDASLVLQLGTAWTDVVKQHGDSERQKAAAAAQAEKLAKDLADTQTAIDKDLTQDGALRSGLGMKLQRQRSKLPHANDLSDEIRAVDIKIEQMGALQAQLEMMIDELEGRGLRGLRFRGGMDDAALHLEMSRLAEINRDIDNYTSDLIELKSHLDETQITAEKFRRLIDSNVLWIRNMRPYELSELKLAWNSFQWVMSPANLSKLLKAAVNEAITRPDILILWLLSSGLLFGFGSKLRRTISELGEQAAKRNQTALRPTLRVLWMSALLAVPLGVFFGVPGWRLAAVTGEDVYVRAVGNALLLFAWASLPVELLRQVVRNGGLAVQHFGLPEQQACVARSTTRFVLDLGLPLILLWGIAHHSGIASINSSLARPLFLAGMVLLAFATWRIMHPEKGVMSSIIAKRPGGWWDRLRYVWHPAISAAPLILGGLSWAGYSYSARQLVEQLYWTMWLVLLLSVVGGLMRRWVMLSRRRLLLAQARQRASEAERRDGAPIDVVFETGSPDLSEINAQTLRLINAVLTVMTVVGLAYMWAPVLPAVRYLDTQVLWHSLDANGDQIPVTLGNLVMSIPIILLTFVSVRNVPGLMENVLLQKLPLENAARYAITTLSSYAMLLVGIIFSAQTLGLRWESIQWLVAALGVGLGFGLQEIFANFISGIILLFEQPIRVGDVVTLDGTTGAVSRIRMRATTIVNWDRQELIIPNKDLITGRLINWTLSDSTNRIVLNIGVAYGTDTQRACEVLEKICQDHVNVADDPPPIVTFEGFGDSTLQLVVRCFLKTLDVRLRTIHELHTEINERFRGEGIEIAFPQRDLHIRSLPAGLAAVINEDGKRAA